MLASMPGSSCHSHCLLFGRSHMAILILLILCDMLTQRPSAQGHQLHVFLPYLRMYVAFISHSDLSTSPKTSEFLVYASTI
jgi:hypothetical protein